jgi:hypothetical protein
MKIAVHSRESLHPVSTFLSSTVQYSTVQYSTVLAQPLNQDVCSCTSTDPVTMEMQSSPVQAHSILAFK